MTGFLLVVGILCLCYYVVIVAYAGISLSFSGIWVLLGAVGLLAAGIRKNPRLLALFHSIPQWIRMSAGLCVLAGILFFLGLEGCIISGMTTAPQTELDGIIVLGAQVRGTRVSRALAQRLDAAAAYLEEHPDTYVIVSGGQGPGEAVSEAQAMSEYLQILGVDEERIIQENLSKNTDQNLRCSFALRKNPQDRMGLVSNGFHIFRAVHIAKAQGEIVEGIPARTDWWMLPHYMMREAFALAKDFLLGNAVW